MNIAKDTTRLAVRQYLFEELVKIHDTCEIGSDHRDISYYNYKEALKITHRGLLIHVKVIINSFGEISVCVHSPPTNGSRMPWVTKRKCRVDLPAPDFGPLLETVKSNIAECMQDLDEGEWIYW